MSLLLERFLRYVQVWTTSDSISADSGAHPSTQNQFDLARLSYSLPRLAHMNKDFSRQRLIL